MATSTPLGLKKPTNGEVGWGTAVTAAIETVDDRINDLGVNVKAASYGALGNGVADDTTAFTNAINAAGAGGRVYVPPGTYILDNWTPAETLDDITLQGAGWGTVLKAKTAASYAMTMSGLWHWKVADLTFDGKSQTANGLKVQGSATSGSQLHTFSHVRFRNSIKGLWLAQGTISQVDKNTYVGCQWADNITGMHIDSVNAQEQLLLGCTLASHTTSIRLTHGGLTMIGGQFETYDTALLLDGANIVWVNLTDVISEVGDIDIDGTTAWPANNVRLTHCILQGATSVVKMGLNGSVLHASDCSFNTGSIDIVADGCLFVDHFNVFAYGAAYNTTGSLNSREKHWRNGVTSYNDGVEGPSLINYIAKPAVTGSRGGNAALASLLTKLSDLGLITDSSS